MYCPCLGCSFISRESSPLLWASTYQAGEHVGNTGKLQEVRHDVGKQRAQQHLLCLLFTGLQLP